MTSNAARPPNRLILPIQYLRGLAAIMVVWYHAVTQVSGVSDHFIGGFANSGVDLFFVISGFIMVATTHGRNPSPLDFIQRRVVRVVPLYWFLTLAMVLLAVGIPSLFRTLIVTPTTLIESLLFVPHFSHSFPNSVWPLLVPGWTLNFEMFFYAVFACSLLLPYRFRIAALIAALGTLVAVGLAFGPFDSAAARVYFSPLLIEFGAGAAIGTWWEARRFAPHASVSGFLLVAGFALLAWRDQPPFYNFTEMIGASMMIAGALNPAFSNRKNRLLRALGDSSYSLYLTHLFTLGILRVIWTKFLPPIASASNAGAFLAAALVACSCVGWLTFRLLETPMLKWFGARMKRSLNEAASVSA